MPISALDIHKRAQERGGGPETLADIIQRARFAAEWHTSQARVRRDEGRGFYAMYRDEKFSTVQREDALYAAANVLGSASIHDDAARFADSIADALIAVTG